MRLTYAIKYVADMDKAIAFHSDVLGLVPKFQSPFWTEFDTGGHFAAMEAPDLLVGDVRSFFRGLR